MFVFKKSEVSGMKGCAIALYVVLVLAEVLQVSFDFSWMRLLANSLTLFVAFRGLQSYLEFLNQGASKERQALLKSGVLEQMKENEEEE